MVNKLTAIKLLVEWLSIEWPYCFSILLHDYSMGEWMFHKYNNYRTAKKIETMSPKNGSDIKVKKIDNFAKKNKFTNRDTCSCSSGNMNAYTLGLNHFCLS